MRSPPADIFVWGVHPETTIDDIVNDLAESDIRIQSTDIEKKSKDGTPLNSYRISVPAADLQKALDPQIWALRVKVREYIYYPRKRQQNDKSQATEKEPVTVPTVSMPPTVQVTPPTQQPTVGQVLPVTNMFDALGNEGVEDIQ